MVFSLQTREGVGAVRGVGIAVSATLPTYGDHQLKPPFARPPYARRNAGAAA
jgi:hypothetical protein